MLRRKLKRLLKSKCIRITLILLSIAGFMWQTCVVSIEYFSYTTTTAVTFVMQAKVKPQAAVLCAPYRQIMDRKRIFKETGIKFAAPETEAAAEENLSEKLTVEQILKYTPGTGGVIKRCLARDSQGDMRKESSDCNLFFKVTKYFTQEFVCYRFKHKQTDNYSVEEITHSTMRSFLLYDIVVNDDFHDVESVLALVYADDDDDFWPFVSRDYAVRQWTRAGPVRDRADQNYIYLMGSDIVVYKLEKPYDTGCLQLYGEGMHECIRLCKMKSYALIDRVPASEILDQPINMKALSEADKRDPVIRSQVKAFDDRCRTQCHNTPCSESYTVTAAIGSRYPNVSLGFSVNTPRQPDLYSRSLPNMTFIEYFSFTMGCFGIWFGISFLTFDPKNLMRSRKHKHHRNGHHRRQEAKT